jgi:hypothetical protein
VVPIPGALPQAGMVPRLWRYNERANEFISFVFYFNIILLNIIAK